jgi:hypothetical protein
MVAQLSEGGDKEQLIWLKKISLLKEVAANPGGKIPDIARGVNISRSNAYNYLDQFTKVWVVTEDEPDFPRKVLKFYNQHLPEGSDQLTKNEVDSLRGIVDRIMKRHEQGQEAETSNSQSKEVSYSTMEDRKEPDVGTNELLLKNILQKMRYVQPQTIDRFMDSYRLGEEEFNKRPEALLEYMRHMFGPGQGEAAFNLFRMTQGKYVDTPGQNNNAINPMLLMALMGGGAGFNPAMMQMMGGQGGGGGQMDQIMMMMMAKQSQQEQEKQASQAMMDKALQVAMLRMVGGSMNDKQPMDSNGQFYVQEQLDENRNVKSRNLVPISPNMPFNPYMMMNNQSNPTMEIILKNALDRENMMMQQNMNQAKPFQELLLTMLPNFRANSNPVEMLGQLRQAMPELFERRQDQNPMDLNVYKLKFDTDLAIMAQKVELKKMDHMWRMEELDRTNANENAKGWMNMLESFGDKLGAPIAGALLQGMGGGMKPPMGVPMPGQPSGPGGILPGQRSGTANLPPGAGAPTPTGEQRGPERPVVVASPSVNPTDPATLMLANAQEMQRLQTEKFYNAQQREIDHLRDELRSATGKGIKPKFASLTPEQISNLPEQVLKQAYLESLEARKMEDDIRTKLETEIANRELLGGNTGAEEQQQELNPESDEGTVEQGEAVEALDRDDIGSEYKEHVDLYRDVAKEQKKKDDEDEEERL